MRRLLFLAATLVATGASAQPALQPLGTYSTGRFDEGAAEIVAYDAATQRAFFVNADAGQVQALDLSDPTAPTLVLTISDLAGTPNGVAVRGGLVAVAVEAPVSTDPGQVRFYTTDGAFVQAVTVGALPDAVAASEDGRYVVVANEGEPADGVDPEGTVSVIDVESMSLSTVRFTDFNRGGPRFAELDGSVLLDPAAPSVAQDFEPEFVAVSRTTAYVTLQEANAVAVVDLPTAGLVGVYGLGLKDYGLAGNGIDPSDRDAGVDIRPVPVLGARQPDAVAAFEEGGVVYLVTANEGDARDGDEARVRDLALDPAAFPNAAELQTDANLGRLEVRPSAGDLDGDGDQDRLVAFGGRSFTVYAVRAGGVEVVFDSGDALERITAERLPDTFNSDNDENGSFDSRSDAKGPEPEGVALGVVDGRRYAFVGLERVGGVVTYDLTDPAAPAFVDYVNNRDFSVDAQLADGSTNPAVGDLGPEGIAFVPAAESPTGAPLVLLSNEVSGTVTAYAVAPGDGLFTLTVLHNNDGESDLLPDERTVDGLTFEAGGIARFGSVVERLRGGAANVLLVSSGDNYLAGPAFEAGRTVGTFYDALGLDALDYDALAVGNHEFDFGPDVFADFVRAFGDGGIDDDGVPPFVSANLRFGGVPSLAALEAEGLLRPSVVVEVGGRRVGIVGATTPALATISSPGDVEVLQNVAELVQAEIDAFLADGVEIVGLISHLQSVSNDRELIAQLSGLDFAVAGGGDELLANDDDLLIPGDEAVRSGDPYPLLVGTAGGATIPVVTTVGGYDYVGRLVLTFDADGDVVGVDDASGPVRVVSEAAGPDGVAPDPTLLAEVERPVADLVDQLGTVVARTEVTLDGTRQLVRTEETNYGDLIADALLYAARQRSGAADVPAPAVALQNGGGIRNSVVVEPGGVTALDVARTLPFSNNVTVVEGVTPAQLKAVLENAVSQVENAGGRFAQVAGLSFTYDPARTARQVDADGAVTAAGDRVRRVVLDDGTVLVRGGAVVASEPVAVATVDFLATPRANGLGGDEYPLAVDGNEITVFDVTYQDALLEYLADGLGGTVTAARYPEGGAGRIGIALTPASPFAFGDFDADGRGDERGEVVEVANTSADLSLALSGGTFVVFDPFSERVTYAVQPSAVVEPGETFTFATSGGDLDLPAGTLPDGPGAFALVQGEFAVGASVRDVLGSVVAAVVYLDEDRVFGRRSGGAGAARRAFDLADALRQVALGADEPVDLAVTTAPNPTRGRTTVAFGVAEPGDVRVAVYDALGRQVAVLADGPVAAGRHDVTFDGAAFPAGVYVVRVEGAEPQTTRVTVVR